MHLVGGGVETVTCQELAPFVADLGRVAQSGSERPRLLLVMADDEGTAAMFRLTYVDTLDALVDGGFDYLDVRLDARSTLDPAALQDVDAIVVAGGPTPGYQRGLAPAAAAVREAVAQGLPYLGFSAGAMVAAGRALLGGWRDGGRPVCDEDWSEELDELTVDAGLGLVDVTVDVHASQGGLLGRAVSVAHRSDCSRVVAIDEGTCLSVPLGWRLDDGWQVSGRGFGWLMEQQAGAVTVRRLPD